MQSTKFTLADFMADPDGFMKSAHESHCPFGETQFGPMALSHAAVLSLLQNKKVRPSFSRVLQHWGITSGAFYEWMSRSPLDMEGETHRVWRRIMARTFTPQSVEKLRSTIRAEADALADGITRDGGCEFIGAFARLLPSFGLCELIGVPSEDRVVFGGWADTIGLGFNMMLVASRIKDIDEALTSLTAYASKLIEARKRDPRDDLITRLVEEAGETGLIGTQRVEATVGGLVFAGHETTKNQLGWMIRILSENPEEWDRVAADPGRAPAVVEEVLRFRSTATNVGRLAVEDVEVAGRKFEKGTAIVASLWTANRDPKEFEKPMEFDADAHAGGLHLAFGQGPHHCLGAALARLELQESLIALASRITCPKIEEGAIFLPPVGINGPTHLPISYSRR